ncbi:MAG: hypothetical protein WAS73_14395 [Defluviicoccus sp.]
MLADAGPGDDAEAVVQNGFLEIQVVLREPIGELGRLVSWERSILAPFTRNEIDPTALHELSREALPIPRVFEVHRPERRIDQREKARESLFVPRMRHGGQQDHPPFGIACQSAQELEPLLLASVGTHASVGLVDDHKVRAGSGKSLPPPFSFDVIETDHRVGVGIEQRLGEGQAAFQSRGSPRGDGDGLDSEARVEF